MGREGGKILFNALTVAYICENVTENRYGAAVRNRNEQPTHRHCTEKSECFQCNSLTACIRTRYDKCLIVLTEREVNRDSLILVNKRMTCLFQMHSAVVVDFGKRTVEPCRKI